MDEAKRFIRYVIPGLAFLLQLSTVGLLIFSYDQIKDFLNLNIAFTAFFASGIIGYLFSSLYYVLHWGFYIKHFAKLDFKDIILKNKNLFSSYKINDQIKQTDAAMTMTSYWEIDIVERGTSNNSITGVMRTYFNVFHSIGTTILIMLFGLGLGIIILCCNDTSIFYYVIYVIGNLVVILILCCNYRLVECMIQNLYNRVFEKLTSKQAEDIKSKNYEVI